MATTSAGTMGAASLRSDAATEIYISGLKNAHALEKQATQLIERQPSATRTIPS